jgi:hypothetical protein
MEWWNGLFTKWYNIPWRIHGAAIYGAPWIPSIYPSHVSIFLPAPWIRHGHYSIAKAMWVMPDPGRISSMSTPSWGLGLPGLPIIQVRRWLSIESQSDLGYPHFWKKQMSVGSFCLTQSIEVHTYKGRPANHVVSAQFPGRGWASWLGISTETWI